MRHYGLIAAIGLAAAVPANAEVSVGEHGFSVRHERTVAASPAAVWDALIHPERWWSPEHSWSGDAANFSLDPRPGGCFCEAMPNSGGTEHMRVVMVQPERLLRLRGELGPMQSEAVVGSLTWTLEPVAGGTRIVHDYAIGGHWRMPVADIAGAVDSVQKIQIDRLAALFAPR